MKKPRIHQDDMPDGLKHNPFAALRPKGEAAPAPEAETEPDQAKPAREPKTPERRAPKTPRARAARGSGPRLVVQREKKGRAGKVVTRISGLTPQLGDPATLTRDLKRALGCGATLDGKDILLQGSLTDRVATWLRTKLDVDVTIGN